MGKWIASRFSLHGRLGVDGLWRGRIALAVSGVAGIVGAIVLGMAAQPSWPAWTPWLAFLPLCFTSLSYVTMLVRRLHDHGRSGLWLLAPAVLIGILFIVFDAAGLPHSEGVWLMPLLFVAIYLGLSGVSLALVYINHMLGQPTPNRFGDPTPGDGLARHGSNFWFRRWFWYPIHWKGWLFATLTPLAFLPIAAAAVMPSERWNTPYGLAILWLAMVAMVIWVNVFMFQRSR